MNIELISRDAHISLFLGFVDRTVRFLIVWLIFSQRLEGIRALSQSSSFDSSYSSSLSSTLSPRIKLQGCAATPLDKKKVVVMGTGGVLGALTFGFLQRTTALFGTGIGSVRSIGATADTARRLNRILSKHFALAVADESYIKLTNMQDVSAIHQRLDGWDALILGNDIGVQSLPVTPGTYEKTPNDKTFECYWDTPRVNGVDTETNEMEREAAVVRRQEMDAVKDRVLNNILLAAERSGIQHIVAVDNQGLSVQLQPKLDALSLSIPHTVIQHSACLSDTKDYTFRKGIQEQLLLSTIPSRPDESMTGKSVSNSSLLAREDVAALCVQSLLQLDWAKTRYVNVRGRRRSAPIPPSGKRHDQEWVVNSYVLEEALRAVS